MERWTGDGDVIDPRQNDHSAEQTFNDKSYVHFLFAIVKETQLYNSSLKSWLEEPLRSAGDSEISFSVLFLLSGNLRLCVQVISAVKT